MKNQTGKKGSRLSCGGASNRRLSVGGAMVHTPKTDFLPPAKATPKTLQAKKNDRLHMHDVSSNSKDDRPTTLSSARRGLDIAGLPVIKHNFGTPNINELESPMVRKPFSPLSSTDASKSNAINVSEDLNRKQNVTVDKTLLSNNRTHFKAPSKTTMAAAEEENKTPIAMKIPVPSTPSTALVPMQTAMTPATPAVLPLNATKAVKEIQEEIEYSFEERRYAFMVSKTQNSLVQVG